MLKKLIKYGNSNALVLDRTLMALLDIEEGSILKLRVEGDQLIIKAAKEAKPSDSLMLEIENIHDDIVNKNPECADSGSNLVMEMNKERIRSYCKGVENNPEALKAIKEWLPGTENGKKLQEAYGKIISKYSEELKILSSEKFLKSVEKLSKKYNGEVASEKYFKDFLALRLKAAPNLGNMDKEMQEAAKSLGCDMGMPGVFKAN